jgi:hypothetical protein
MVPMIERDQDKYKDKLALAGCWEWIVPETWPEVSEEAVRQSVRDIIDTYAPGGGFAFGGGAVGRFGDQTIENVNHWVQEEAYYYGKKMLSISHTAFYPKIYNQIEVEEVWIYQILMQRN